jgi:hypothetical protein
MSRNEKIDLYLKKWVSRKLMAFMIASVALFTSNIDSDNWTVVAAIYIGSQAATEIAERLFKARGNYEK